MKAAPMTPSELRRLAEAAQQMPWEPSPADVPYSCRAEFKDAITPQTMLALLDVVDAAQELDEKIVNQFPVAGPFAALRSALDAIKRMEGM